MVKRRKKHSAKRGMNQGQNEGHEEPVKISPNTRYEYCSERLSPFGGLLALEKFMDAVKFREVFEGFYQSPGRTPNQGHYQTVYGILVLLFIGFTRLWHFQYIQTDPLVCALFGVSRLPHVTTYWRYVASLGINQGKSLLLVMAALRERVWQLCEISYPTIHVNLDTTVETLFGDQEGGRKGHNTRYRGKKGFRPVLGFIEETREYIVGKLRKGATISGKEVAEVIRNIKKHLPACVKKVILRGDGEFISWDAVKAAEDEGHVYIFGNKACKPPFDSKTWYKSHKNDTVEYNECWYKPTGWPEERRFVCMRIPGKKSSKADTQIELLEDGGYTYRDFVTNLSGRPHQAIDEYDKRADCENQIGEVKREGLSAIPTRRFMNNYAYFQIVLLAYNIWRSFKMLAEHSEKQKKAEEKTTATGLVGIQDNTLRIARLKLLLIAAKLVTTGNTTKVKYSEHDSRAAGLFSFMGHLDRVRTQARPWLDGRLWQCRHMNVMRLQPAENSS
jgi:Transposase DDE domain group 1